MGSERYQIKPDHLKQARKHRVKVIAVFLAISSTAALAVAFFIDRAGADFDQKGDTPHLDYQGYGNWSFALSGGTIEQRSQDAKAIVEDAVPDCRQLTQQLRRVADNFATAIDACARMRALLSCSDVCAHSARVDTRAAASLVTSASRR